MPRSPQGRPVIFQAGDSDEGREFAAPQRRRDLQPARHVGGRPGLLRRRQGPAGQLRPQPRPADDPARRDVRARRHRRGGGRLAREIRLQQVSGQTAIKFLEQLWNRDLSGHDPDGPLPDVDPGLGEHTIAKGRASVRMHPDPIDTASEWRAKAEAERLSIRDLIIEVTGRQSFIGSPATVADTIDHFVQEDASDGFILVPHITPGGLDEFADTGRPAAAGAGRASAPTTRAPHCASTSASRRCRPPRRHRRERRPTGIRMNTPLGVLDLVPIPSGSSAAQALRNSIDLARQAERFGYARYWFAEHHLNPGRGRHLARRRARADRRRHLDDPARLRRGAARSPHRAVDGRGVRPDRRAVPRAARSRPRPFRRPASRGTAAGSPRPPTAAPGSATAGAERAADPGPVRRRPAAATRRASRCSKTLLQQPGAQPQDYAEQVADILALLAGTLRRRRRGRTSSPARARTRRSGSWAAAAGRAHRSPGANGLRFAANYHVSPATVLEAVDGYRAAFRPSAELAEPYVSVSADVVVADDEAAARELAAGYGLWVRSIRSGEGAIAFPTPEQARAPPLDRRGPAPGRGPARDPVRRDRAAGRRTPRAASRRHRGRRADHHDDHP